MTTEEAIAILERGGLLKVHKVHGWYRIDILGEKWRTDTQLIALATTLARGNDTPEGNKETI